MSNNTKNNLVPSLRFKEFTHAWEQDLLGNLISIQTGKLDTYQKEENGKYNFYTSGTEIHKINKWDFEGDSIIVAGSGVNLGFPHFANGRFNANQRTFVLKTFQDNTKFIYYYSWNNLYLEIQKKFKIGGIPNLLKGDIFHTKIYFPTLKEQTKIANLLETVDSILSLHKRKYNFLKNIKNTLLDKMFPSQNS
ncbi:restriction endonuclease subunit S, partial [Mycoplasma sp. 1012]